MVVIEGKVRGGDEEYGCILGMGELGAERAGESAGRGVEGDEEVPGYEKADVVVASTLLAVDGKGEDSREGEGGADETITGLLTEGGAEGLGVSDFARFGGNWMTSSPSSSSSLSKSIISTGLLGF